VASPDGEDWPESEAERRRKRRKRIMREVNKGHYQDVTEIWRGSMLVFTLIIVMIKVD